MKEEIEVTKLKSKEVIFIIVLLAIYFLLIKLGYITINIVTSNHFNLITVNSVFAGFLFSSLALIISLSNDKVLITLERAEYMESIYRNIVFGITGSLISIAISLFNVFMSPAIAAKISTDATLLKDILDHFIPGMELFFLILVIISFLLAVRDVKFIISSVRSNIKSEYPKPEEMKETLDLIK